MSDYLWDKSGEPDPTIGRLENLLAARRYKSEPLRLPPAIPLPAPRALRPRAAYTQLAALAAGIVLATIIGVWMLTMNKSEGTENVFVAADNARQKAPGEESEPPSAFVVSAPLVGNTVGLEGKRARRQMRQLFRAPRREARTIKRAADEPLRVARLGRTSLSMSPDGVRPSAGVEGAGGTEADSRTLIEQRLAKEQLMLAMRVTSAKLNIARNKTQAAHAAEGGLR